MSARIAELRTENFMRLKAVQVAIEPDKSVVIVGGRNAQGKSSLLDSIMVALAGGKTVPQDPVNRGGEQAEIEIKLDNGITIQRIIQKDRSHKLRVFDAKGGQYSSPQKMLDALTRSIAFDPLEFARADEKEQRKMLEKLIGIDGEQLERDRRRIYDDRTAVGQIRDKAKAKYNSMRYNPDAPKELLDANDLVDELRKAEEQNSRITRAGDVIKEVEAKIDDLKEQLDRQETRLRALKEIQETPLIDTAELRTKLDSISELNQAFYDNQRYSEVAVEMTEADDRYDHLTNELGAIDMIKRNALAEAKLPVEGLDFGGDGVTYQGIALSQASQAERVRVSMALAMAMNPDLRVMLMREGAFLDHQNLALIGEMASAAGYQVWIERVGKEDVTTIEIEDGVQV